MAWGNWPDIHVSTVLPQDIACIGHHHEHRTAISTFNNGRSHLIVNRD